MRGGRIEVEEVDDPTPGPGQRVVADHALLSSDVVYVVPDIRDVYVKA